MRYMVVIEKGDSSFGSYVPDLPGCVAAADSKEEALKLIEEAIESHIQSLRQDGQPVPKLPSSPRQCSANLLARNAKRQQ